MMQARNFVFAVFLVCVAEHLDTLNVNPLVAASPQDNNEFITQTVYGFLDFTTTIGNTVMVFSPQSAPPEGQNEKEKEKEKTTVAPPIETKPTEAQKKSVPEIQPSKTHKSDSQGETKKQVKGTKIVVNSVVKQNVNFIEDKVTKSEEVKPTTKLSTDTPVVSSIVQIQSKEETAGVKNNLAEPEYDYLSRQPTEVIDETYKLINLRPSSKAPSKPRPSGRREKENPTGLVTKLGGTNVKDGLTTVHETSVIGTYINGKYAQILQSSSRILPPTPPSPEGKIRPSSTLRILKTIGPHGKHRPHLEPTPTNHQEESSLPLEALFDGSSSTYSSS